MADRKNKKTEYDEVTAMRMKTQKDMQRRRRINIGILLGALGAAAVIISIAAFNMRGYSSYKNTDAEVIKTDEPGAVYMSYRDGYIRGSHSGAEYVDAGGKTVWNEAAAFSNPKIMVYGDKIFVADIGGNRVDVFDAGGNIGRVETPNSIYAASGTAGGRVAIMTQDNNANYLGLYESNGEEVYEIKTSLGGDGYPLAFDVSSDGSILAEAYVKAEKKPVETGIRFYDFSGSKINEGNKIAGEFNDPDGELTGEICFFENANAAAVSEGRVRFYSTEGKSITLKSEYDIFEEYDGTVKRVLKSGDRLALILSVTEADAPERLVVFGDNGRRLCDQELTESYDRYSLEGGNVIMTGSNRFAIYTTSGKEITRQTSDKPVSAIIGNGGGGKYFLVSNGNVQRIKLS